MSGLSQLKVCFVAGTLEHGGAERQLFYLLRELRRAGTSVRLLSLERGGFWEEKIAALGVPIVWVGERRSRLWRLFRILKEARKDSPDIMQSQHFYANAYAGLAARLLHAHGIGAMRSDGRTEEKESGSVGGWLNMRCSATIAANSQNALRYARTRGVPAERLFLLPNVVDTEKFQFAQTPAPEPITLIGVGRLVTEKRFDRFITLLHRLRTEHHLPVRGLIVGAGCQDEDLRPQLEQQASRLGISPGIIQFCGSVADIRPWFRESAICVLNSDYEGTPNVLLEAMSCGLPVVASNVGGVPEIVRHGQTGFLFEPDDLAGFTLTLAELVKNPALRAEIGRRARNYVEENHSVHRLPQYLENLYQLPSSAHRANARTASHVPMEAETQSANRV